MTHFVNLFFRIFGKIFNLKEGGEGEDGRDHQGGRGEPPQEAGGAPQPDERGREPPPGDAG